MSKKVPPSPQRTPRDEKTDATDRRDVTVYLPVDLHRALKVYAAQNDLTVSAIVEEAVRDFLARSTNIKTEH